MLGLLLAAAISTGFWGTSQAGEATFTFDTDEGLVPISNLTDPGPLRDTGGNPATGGYLAITDAVGSQSTAVLIPDFDGGLIVSAFSFEMDVRIGNGTTDRGADGFSISYARSNDPLLTDGLSNGNFAGGVPEAGATTGIAISFDAWSGNALPDGDDTEGVIVRVDNETVLRFDMPTRHGAADDVTSLQTGPIDPSDARTGSTDNLEWVPLSVELNEDGQLTVSWKGTVILQNFQTQFFPSPGRLILAGRTGGANQNQHIDNLHVTTTASDKALLTGFTHSPNGFMVEFTDAPTSVIDTGSLVLTVDGNTIPAEQINQVNFGDFTHRFFYTAPTLFPSGSDHVMTAAVGDGSGGTIEADRDFTTVDYATLPTSLALAESDIDMSRPGFRVKSYSVDNSSTTIQWAEDTLNGLNGADVLPHTFGPDLNNDGDITNDSATRDSDGYWYEPNQINYDQDGGGATGVGRFFDPNFVDSILTDHPIPEFDIFTGTPVADNISTEILTYVHFPEAKVYTMVVNSDDGFKVSSNPNISDQLGTVIGAFNGGRGSSDTFMYFNVEEPGYYPMRLLWFEGGGGANCEWFIVNDDGSRNLINGDIPNGALPSFAYATGNQDHAYVGNNNLNSLIGGGSVQANASFSAEIVDGIETIDPASVSFTVNGSDEGVEISKSGGTITASRPGTTLLPSGGDIEISLSYDAGGETHTSSVTGSVAAYANVSTALMTAPGTGNASEPGFRWSTYQVESGGGTSIALNEDVLAGNIGDNVADLANADEGNTFFITDVINFDQGGGASGNFSSNATAPLDTADVLIPGIPGTGGSDDNIAGEALTYVEFPSSGLYTMGVNSDDGFLVSVATSELGLDPADPGNQRLGAFDGGRGASDTLFSFAIPEAGVYPLRLLWWEGGGGANVEWFTQDTGGSRFLVNESRDGALKAFRSRTVEPNPPTEVGTLDAPSIASGNATISWTGDGTLEEATVLGPNADWTTSADQSNPQTRTAADGDRYFRLTLP